MESNQCSRKGCKQPKRCRSLCDKHFQELYRAQVRSGDWVPIGRIYPEKKVCSIEHCTELVKAKGMCSSHYNKHRWAENYANECREREKLYAGLEEQKKAKGVTDEK